jgi:hypothetical protein
MQLCEFNTTTLQTDGHLTDNYSTMHITFQKTINHGLHLYCHAVLDKIFCTVAGTRSEQLQQFY